MVKTISLKFVVDKEDDIKEIKVWLEKFRQFILSKNSKNIEKFFDLSKIFLMPQAQTKKQYQEKLKMLSEICIKNNYNLTPRLHIGIWSNKRAV